MDSLTVNFIRHIIGLQWNLKVKDILPDSISKESDNPFEVCEKTIRSSPFQIKYMEDSTFHLELTSKLNVLINGYSRGSFQLFYVFAVVKDRAFLVKKNDKLKFLDRLKLKHLNSAEEVTFHCLVLVKLPVLCATFTKSSLADFNKKIIPERLVHVDLESIQHLHSKFDGEIPEFTFDKAKELVSKEVNNSVLKVLAIEYLFKSIEATNVTDILNIAINQNLKVLQKRCSDFLKECRIETETQSDIFSFSSDESEYIRRRTSGWSPISSTDFSFYNSD